MPAAARASVSLRAPRAAARGRPARGRPPTAGLRERILRAAEPIFLRQDFHGVRMDDVALASGVGKGTLYRYFRSKQALYGALLLGGMERLAGELEGAVRAPGEPVARLAGLVRGFLAHVVPRRRFLALLLRHELELGRAELREWERRRRRLTAVIEGAIGEAVRAGQLRPLEPRLGAEILVGVLRGVERSGASPDALDVAAAQVLDFFLVGAGTPAGRRAWDALRRRGLA